MNILSKGSNISVIFQLKSKQNSKGPQFRKVHVWTFQEFVIDVHFSLKIFWLPEQYTNNIRSNYKCGTLPYPAPPCLLGLAILCLFPERAYLWRGVTQMCTCLYVVVSSWAFEFLKLYSEGDEQRELFLGGHRALGLEFSFFEGASDRTSVGACDGSFR